MHPSLRPPSPSAVALAGAMALAVAMGIGRFAFTPLLPMMLADGSTDLPTASWLASANYLGYLAGALFCTLQPWLRRRLPRLPAPDPPRWVRAGLAATCLLTAAMALPWPSAWPVLRFAAGVASALVFVYTSGWCLAQLAQRGRVALGGAIYTGPGAGIVVSGLAVGAMVAAQWQAASGWALFGGLAALLSASVWRTFRGQLPSLPVPAAGTAAASTAATGPGRGEIACLALAYGLAGFGYIVTATFLPVIARSALTGSPWLDLFWPLFGAGVVAGALAATRLRTEGDLRRLLAAAYLLQATGIVIPVLWPTLAGFAAGSALLGLPFTAITFFAMQEVRRLKAEHAAATMGLLTATYGVGQVVGPPMVAALLGRAARPQAGFAASLGIAAGALAVGALLYLAMTRWYPRR